MENQLTVAHGCRMSLKQHIQFTQTMCESVTRLQRVLLVCFLVYFFLFLFLVRGMRERSPPLPKIAHPSLPRLGRSQASTRQSARPESPPGGTACLITVSPVPGKLTSDSTARLIYLHGECNTYGFSTIPIFIA